MKVNRKVKRFLEYNKGRTGNYSWWSNSNCSTIKLLKKARILSTAIKMGFTICIQMGRKTIQIN